MMFWEAVVEEKLYMWRRIHRNTKGGTYIHKNKYIYVYIYRYEYRHIATRIGLHPLIVLTERQRAG